MAHHANAMNITDLSTAGHIRLAAQLHQEINLLLADRGSSVLDHPAILYLGDFAGQGSDVFELPFAGLMGYDKMVAVAENADAAPTALTAASPQLTIARQALYRQVTGLGALTASLDGDPTKIEVLARDMVAAARMRLVEMFAGIVDDFSSTVGTTTVDLSVDDFFDAQYTLTQASVPGPYAAMLYPVQVTDLQGSIRAEAGALQFRAATQEMLDIKGPDFVGEFNGVDIFASSDIPTANAAADSAGGMWGRGAIGYGDMSVGMIPEKGIPAGTKIRVGTDYDEPGDYNRIIGNYYCGVVECQDSMGVSIITDR